MAHLDGESLSRLKSPDAVIVLCHCGELYRHNIAIIPLRDAKCPVCGGFVQQNCIVFKPERKPAEFVVNDLDVNWLRELKIAW